MGIVRMCNVTVIGHLPVMGDVVDALQQAGVVEVLASPHDLPSPQLPGAEYELVHSSSNLDRARRATAVLERYHANPQPMSMFVTEKFHTSKQRFRELAFDARAEDTYRLVTEADSELQLIQEEVAALRETIDTLTPWVGYDVPVERWGDIGTVQWFRGTVRTQVVEGVGVALAALELVDLEIVSATEGMALDRVAVAVSAHESVADEVANALSELGFERTAPGNAQGTPGAVVAQARERIAYLENTSAEVEAQLAKLAAERYGEMFLLVSALESASDRSQAAMQFGATQQTFIATGWVPAKREADLRSTLAPWGGLIDITLTEPDDAAQVPVELENPSWLQPFELLTDLYGRPRYGEVDPTPLIAPFFTLFIALCIGDVGYGLMLVVAMHLISTRLHVAPGVRRFAALVTYGGWMSVPVGIAFGSYLALPYEYLPTVLQRLRVIDPLNEVVVLLGFTLVLGAIQVVLGIIVAAWSAFRRGDPESAVGSHLSVLFLLGCIAAYVLTSAQYPVLLGAGIIVTVLLQGRALSVAFQPSDRPVWDRALGFLWLVAVLALAVSFGVDGMVVPALWALLTLTAVGAGVSHTARRALVATLGGAYAVYGLTGILNDTLSYTRLAALGLSSALVGMVFNIMAQMVWAPAASYFAAGGWGMLTGGVIALLAATVFTVGHVFNVTVNLLGAFVHPMRLQFVEFFGKFYEAGNRPFQPLRYRQDRIVFSAGKPGEKGGVS